MIKSLTGFTQSLIIWGSDNVLKSFYSLRENLLKVANGNPSNKVLFHFEDLLLEIRKDLGPKNKNIKKGDILGIFINDIKEYIK
jgi:hypothetical protein